MKIKELEEKNFKKKLIKYKKKIRFSSVFYKYLAKKSLKERTWFYEMMKYYNKKRMKILKNCVHNCEPYETTRFIKGIERHAMVCPICKQILDYYPQY